MSGPDPAPGELDTAAGPVGVRAQDPPGAAAPAGAAVEPAVAVVEAASATLPAPGVAKPALPADDGGPAHRGAESTPYNDILHRTLKPPVRVLLNRIVMRIRLEGVENVPRDEPLIFAGNHSSWLDGPLVVIESPRTVRCLTKVEMYQGIVGWLLRLVGQIPIDRGKADRVALHTALDELARGKAIGVFPEGTRGSGEMAAVQHGIAYLAVHGRCRVLPVACLGTGDALPKGARLPKRSVRVRVVFGEPFAVEIPANPRSRKALAAVAEDIRVRLADHLTAARAA
jgi:1-acyl-sn-glycerol-3-phosphate acyltransferase